MSQVKERWRFIQGVPFGLNIGLTPFGSCGIDCSNQVMSPAMILIASSDRTRIPMPGPALLHSSRHGERDQADEPALVVARGCLC